MKTSIAWLFPALLVIGGTGGFAAAAIFDLPPASFLGGLAGVNCVVLGLHYRRHRRVTADILRQLDQLHDLAGSRTRPPISRADRPGARRQSRQRTYIYDN
jgi:hypothetical protein